MKFSRLLLFTNLLFSLRLVFGASSSATLSLKAVDSTGKPLAGAEVTILSAAPIKNFNTRQTDDAGLVTLNPSRESTMSLCMHRVR